ncbi:MAG: hypothetical protein ACLTQG_30325 [Hungatella sp.]|uniref:hypothetical protein n=1 Tax=Hungatella sp. TaxID=2613924 RepID=UPI00399276A9
MVLRDEAMLFYFGEYDFTQLTWNEVAATIAGLIEEEICATFSRGKQGSTFSSRK